MADLHENSVPRTNPTNIEGGFTTEKDGDGAGYTAKLDLPRPVPGGLAAAVPEDAERLARDALDRISDAHSGMWAHAKLSSLATISSLRVLNAWSIARVTVRERRWVEDTFVAYRNERLPRLTIKSADEVDPAAYTFFDDDQDEGEEQQDVTGSARLVSCHECKRGKLPCESCDGVGKEDCDFCDGVGRDECHDCLGGGRVPGERGMKNCPHCSGKGSVSCELCRRGKIKCSTCEGTGKADCSTCEGRGKAIQVLRVRAERVRFENQDERSHSDLASLLSMLKCDRFVSSDESELGVGGGRLAVGGERVAIDENGALTASGEERVERETTRALCGLTETVDILRQLDSIAFEGSDTELTVLHEHARQVYRGIVRLVNADGLPVLPAEFGFPDLAPGITFIKREYLGVPSLRLMGDDSVDSATSWLGGAEVLHGDVPVPSGVLAPEVLASALGEIATELASADSPLPGEGEIVRDYVAVFGRAWLCVDFDYDATTYRAFLGRKNAYCPSGSPIADEPTRLVAEARRLAEQEDGEAALAAIRRALAHELLWPDSEHLAMFLTALPKLPIERGSKLAILDAALEARIRRASNPHPFFEWKPGRVGAPLINSVRVAVNAPVQRLAIAVVVAVLLIGAALAYLALAGN